MNGTGDRADIVRRLSRRAAGNQRVLVIFFGQWKWSVLLQQTERQAVHDIHKRTLFSIMFYMNPKVYYLHYHLFNGEDMERAMMKDYAYVCSFLMCYFYRGYGEDTSLTFNRQLRRDSHTQSHVSKTVKLK